MALHDGLGPASGFAAGRRGLRLPRPDAQAVGFEVGMQNTRLAIALVLGAGLDPPAIIPPAIFDAWDSISGAALAHVRASRPADFRDDA